MSDSVNPILVRPVLGTVKPEIQFCSGQSSLCHGCSLVTVQIGPDDVEPCRFTGSRGGAGALCVVSFPRLIAGRNLSFHI